MVDEHDVLFEDGMGVVIERVTRRYPHSTREWLTLVVGQRQVATSTQKFKGKPEAWVRARLKSRLNYVNRKIGELRKFEDERFRLEAAYERYQK